MSLPLKVNIFLVANNTELFAFFIHLSSSQYHQDIYLPQSAVLVVFSYLGSECKDRPTHQHQERLVRDLILFFSNLELIEFKLEEMVLLF